MHDDYDDQGTGTERMYRLAQASFKALVMLPKAVLVSSARRAVSTVAWNSLYKI